MQVGVIHQTIGEKFALYHGDSCQVMRGIPDNSIDYCIHSPPFEDLYIYSDSVADLGNSRDTREFFRHYWYIIRELHRVMVPGRIVDVHCKDLPRYFGHHGAAGLHDFPGLIIRWFMRAGFQFHSRVAIWKDPEIEAQRTNNSGLLYGLLCKDSTVSRMGMADYLISFRKWDGLDGLTGPRPVVSEEQFADRFHRYVGTEPPDPTDIAQRYGLRPPPRGPDGKWPRVNPFEPGTDAYRQWSIRVWRLYASPVWWDISQTRVLNVSVAREDGDEKHLCLARGSLVLTYERGYIPIEEVEVGQRVLTHEGRWKPVTAKQCNGVREVIRSTAQGVADLRTTPDHKIWTRKARTMHPRKIARETEPTWIEAQETLGSYVNLKLPPIEESPLSAQEWWVIGRWLGDGHRSSRGRLHISCGDHEIESLKGQLGDFAGAAHHTGTSWQIGIKDRSGRLREMLSRFGNGAAGKVLPGEALALEPAKAEALLSGYLSADGHYAPRYGRWMASSISRALLLGMAMVAQRARGVVASVYAGREGGEDEICGRKVHAQDDWVLSIPPRNLSAMLLEDGAWKKVRRLEEAGEAEVWDIRVADDKSFTAEGCIVHNCPLQLDVIDRGIHLRTNPGDRVFTPFAGIGSEPVQAVEHGRYGIGIELKESYYRTAARNLQALESRPVQSNFLDAA